MSEGLENTQNNNWPSEQAKYVPEWHAGGAQEMLLDDRYRARAIVAGIQYAERQIGSRYKGTLQERARYILQEASRTRTITPRSYQLAWFIWHSPPKYKTGDRGGLND